MALSRSARPNVRLEGQAQNLVVLAKLNQVSALSPARRVQWILDCWPAPTPMAWPSIGVADGVGLGVFEGDQGDNEVPLSASRAALCWR